MDATNEQQSLLDIKQKYEHFKASKIYYDEIDYKLAQIRNDIVAVKVIKDSLLLNITTDEKCTELVKMFNLLEEYLEEIMEVTNERLEYLDEMKRMCLNESDEGYFRRTFCSPDDENDNYESDSADDNCTKQ